MNFRDIEKLTTDFGGVVLHVAQTYGPAAANAVFTLTRIQCIYNIAVALIGAVAFSVIGTVLVRLSKTWYKDSGISGPFPIAAIGALVCFFPCVLINVCDLLNVWNWVGAFSPQLYLAHQLLVKVVGQ